MNYPKLLSIMAICGILLYSAVSYSEFGAPAEFGNLTNTTCWIGGDYGIVNCTGDAYFTNIYADIINISNDAYIQDVLIVSNEIRLGSDGSLSDPGYTWVDDTDMGLFRSGVDTLGFVTEGKMVMNLTDSQDVEMSDCLTVTNEIRLGTNGSQTDPGFTWKDDMNTGMFRAGNNILGFTTAGSEAMRIDANGNVVIMENLTASVSASNVDRDIPSNCSTNYAVTGWDNNLSTTYCTQFEEPGDYQTALINSSNITCIGNQCYTNVSIPEVDLSTYLQNGTDANFKMLNVTQPSGGSGDKADPLVIVGGYAPNTIFDSFDAGGILITTGDGGDDSIESVPGGKGGDIIFTLGVGGIGSVDGADGRFIVTGPGTAYFNQSVNVTGNITADNVWLPSYLFAHTNNTIEVATGGVWQNVTFDEEASTPKQRVTHTHSDGTNDTFTIVDDGDYLINFAISFQDDAASPTGHCVVRLIKNGVEIPGSLLEEDSHKQYHDFTVTNGPIATLSTGDEIKMQFTADDTSVSMQSHATYGDHKDSATLRIHRVG